MPRSTLKRRWSFSDLQSVKAVRSNSYPFPRNRSPLLMMFPEDVCSLYYPDEDRVYYIQSDFSGIRFLGSSGKWSLVVDSRSDLYIIDVFSGNRIDLPPLESFKGELFGLDRLGDKEFKYTHLKYTSGFPYASEIITVEKLRGVLWVDDKEEDYVVVWRFDTCEFIGYCKKGDDHYLEIPVRNSVRRELQGLSDMVLKGYSLYIFTTRQFIRHLDLSGKDGFKDVSENYRSWMQLPFRSKDKDLKFIDKTKILSRSKNIAVTTSGEVLVVVSIVYKSTLARDRVFSLYKRDPSEVPGDRFTKELVKVDSLGDEALILDLGITVPANRTLGIEPNCIYFTRHDRTLEKKLSCLDICVYNLTTKTLKRFPSLLFWKLDDAHWFLPF